MLVSYLQCNLRSYLCACVCVYVYVAMWLLYYKCHFPSLSLSCFFGCFPWRNVHFIRLQSQLLIFLSIVYSFFLLFTFISGALQYVFSFNFFLTQTIVVAMPLLTSIAISISVIYCVIMQTRQEIKWDFMRVYLVHVKHMKIAMFRAHQCCLLVA